MSATTTTTTSATTETTTTTTSTTTDAPTSENDVALTRIICLNLWMELKGEASGHKKQIHRFVSLINDALGEERKEEHYVVVDAYGIALASDEKEGTRIPSVFPVPMISLLPNSIVGCSPLTPVANILSSFQESEKQQAAQKKPEAGDT